MKQSISLAVALWLAVLLPEGNAVAQSGPDSFRGSTWRLISASVERGGRTVHWAAPRLQGFLMFDSHDRFLIVITRTDLSKNGSNPGQTGTSGGNLATLRSSISSFGTYSIDSANHTINVHIEASTFPKWTGTDQKRLFTVAGDKLKLTKASPSGGPGATELVWDRVK